jgi:hypothetical protein
MDGFTKAALAVIALALSAIAVKMWEPAEAHAQSFLQRAPTIGDFQDAKDQEAKVRLYRSVPVVQVRGGSISIQP